MQATLDFDIDTLHSEVLAVKGIVFIGDKIVVYTRDKKCRMRNAGKTDLPGGKRKPGETPFQTFARELWEEIGIRIKRHHVIYARSYSSIFDPGKTTVVVAVQLTSRRAKELKFGSEGTNWRLVRLDDFLADHNSVYILQQRAGFYLNWAQLSGSRPK